MKFWVLKGREPVEVPDVQTWAKAFCDNGRRIAWDHIQDWVTVSTVFLGIDHRFGASGPPLLFETMLFFAAPDHPEEQKMWRYATYDEAESWHRYLVEFFTDKAVKAPKTDVTLYLNELQVKSKEFSGVIERLKGNA